MMRDDTNDILRGLEQDVEGVLDKYYPGWITKKVKSQDVALLTPKKKGKHITSSFTMNLSGDRRGQWYRFSEGKGGSTIGLIFYAETGRTPSGKSDWADAFNFARDFLGMQRTREESQQDKAARDAQREQDRLKREERDKRLEQERIAAEAVRIMTAIEVWNSSQPLAGSHAEQYLISRGIYPVSEWPWDPHETLRFHPSLDHEMDRRAGRMPAFICLVRDPFGNPTAVWQEYLDRKMPAKADIELPKLGRGPLNGGAIRIGGDAPRIGVGEGSLTCIGLWELEGYRKPIWATTSTSGMVGFEVPLSVDHVSIYHDGDKAQVNKHNLQILDPPGDRAARSLYERLKATGIGTNLNEMPLLGDGLDLKVTFNEYEKRASARRGTNSTRQHPGGADRPREDS